MPTPMRARPPRHPTRRKHGREFRGGGVRVLSREAGRAERHPALKVRRGRFTHPAGSMAVGRPARLRPTTGATGRKSGAGLHSRSPARVPPSRSPCSPNFRPVCSGHSRKFGLVPAVSPNTPRIAFACVLSDPVSRTCRGDRGPEIGPYRASLGVGFGIRTCRD